MQTNEMILKIIKDMCEAFEPPCLEMTRYGQIEAGRKWFDAKWAVYRSMQRIEWLFNPTPRRWSTEAGNIWYWTEDGMGLGAPLKPGDSPYSEDGTANHVELRPSSMSDLREL